MFHSAAVNGSSGGDAVSVTSSRKRSRGSQRTRYRSVSPTVALVDAVARIGGARMEFDRLAGTAAQRGADAG